ncbi:MAG: sigma-54 dependent transcriptional regulator [Candidatus Cloacimonetes bacterium]|nr:sigma-54 dependent transcriptional regulator [Candidatus Cloacimonadota bacterium]
MKNQRFSDLNKQHILIIDDEAINLKILSRKLETEGYEVIVAASGETALHLVKQSLPDLILLDIMMPDMDGYEVCTQLKNSPLTQDIPLIFLTSKTNTEDVIKGFELGAVDYVGKPFKSLELLARVKTHLKLRSTENQLQKMELNYSLINQELLDNIGSEIIGSSDKMQAIINLMTKVAKFPDTSVLITGESGTGKELVARGIHALSPRSKNYFYAVNCSAIPESLFESEFFGHKKGAFTGADEHRTGMFEIADKGTLFLDEVADMKLELQGKLLRVLEEKKVTRVGTHKEIPVDVRVIAATNQNISDMLAEKNFRLDLYHRLNTFEIHIPPLRERPQDIPPLVEYYAKHISNRLKKKISAIDDQVFNILQNYDFPGNIRELKNFIEKAVILCDSNQLTMADFPNLSPGSNYALPQKDLSSMQNADFNLDNMEKNLVILALQKANNNKSQAAQLLAITRQALDRRLKKYNLD